ncbi:MAG: patatin-like phospholipase family protein [Clostridiales bacterium]
MDKLTAENQKLDQKTGRIRPKIGLALGGGATKGTAHIGVIQVLEEFGIPIDMISGTSIGSFIAALYACGYDSKKMDLLFREFDMEKLMKVRPSRMGMIPADGYQELISVCTKNARIENAVIPLRIVAVDLVSWQKIIFTEGDMATAVRASSAVPGAITPVKMGDMLLADGYLLDNVPCSVLREMGADIVIGVSLSKPSYSQPKTMIEVMLRSLDIMSFTTQTIDADWILRPIDQEVGFLDMKMMEPCRKMGETTAREGIDTLLDLISMKTEQLNSPAPKLHYK